VSDREPMSAESVARITATIEEGWKAAVSAIREAEAMRTAELRGQYERLARRLLVMSCVLILSVVGGLIAFKAQLDGQRHQAATLTRVVAQQQRSRRVTLIDRCRRDNDLKQHLQQFIVKAAPKLTPLAERLFPITPDCARYAGRLLYARRPPTPPRR
jgi:hypothetical protein